MVYEVYETYTFSEFYETLEKEEQLWISKIKLQLKENPKVGKPLKFN